jgi:hypothetical protein
MRHHPIHVVVRDDFILNRVFASFAPTEVRKSIISKLKLYAVMSPKAVRFDLVVNLEHVQNTSEN